MHGSRTAFNLHNALVVAGVATENKAAPVARLALSRSFLGSKYNRKFGCSAGNDLSPRFHNEGCTCFVVAFDNGARLNDQCSTVCYVAPAFEQVNSFFNGLVVGNDKLLFTVTYLVIAKNNVVVGFVVTAVAGGKAGSQCKCQDGISPFFYFFFI